VTLGGAGRLKIRFSGTLVEGARSLKMGRPSSSVQAHWAMALQDSKLKRTEKTQWLCFMRPEFMPAGTSSARYN
jgi:hypothetical protein